MWVGKGFWDQTDRLIRLTFLCMEKRRTETNDALYANSHRAQIITARGISLVVVHMHAGSQAGHLARIVQRHSQAFAFGASIFEPELHVFALQARELLPGRDKRIIFIL